MHPHFKEDNVTSLKKKSDPSLGHYESEHFAHKFKASLLKLLELKGVRLTLKTHQSDHLHRPVLESSFEEVLVLSIYNEGEHKGHLYLEEHMVSELIHKMMGGGDRVTPTIVKFPLSKMELKTLENAFGILTLSLREGLKHAFPLGKIDLLSLKGPLNQFDFTSHLENIGDVVFENFIFETTHGEFSCAMAMIFIP